MADAAPQRWTTPDATPAVNGGFVAYGDYLKLKAEAAALRKDAERWRMVPMFLAEFQIDYVGLSRAIDAALAAKEGEKG